MITEETTASAGLLMFRRFERGVLEFFLTHPGGPYFRRKDKGVWTIPKGLIQKNEIPLDAARREFEEETGIIPAGPFISLESIRQKSGKVVHAWAFEGDWDPVLPIKSNTFKLEWPPESGKFQYFPEIDRAAWMTFDVAKEYILPAQLPLLQRAVTTL